MPVIAQVAGVDRALVRKITAYKPVKKRFRISYLTKLI
jgi:hypothetical protein